MVLWYYLLQDHDPDNNNNNHNNNSNNSEAFLAAQCCLVCGEALCQWLVSSGQANYLDQASALPNAEGDGSLEDIPTWEGPLLGSLPYFPEDACFRRTTAE